MPNTLTTTGRGKGGIDFPGRNGEDLILTGSGNDTAIGGSGNDVLIFGEGQNVGRGGQGVDLFVFDSDTADAQTRLRDFDPEDLFLFSDLDSPIPTGAPEGATLADLENGTVDEFVCRESGRGVEIQAGDHRGQLVGVTADEILLSRLAFTGQDPSEVALTFGAETGHFMTYGDGVGPFMATGTDADSFITFGDGAGV